MYFEYVMTSYYLRLADYEIEKSTGDVSKTNIFSCFSLFRRTIEEQLRIINIITQSCIIYLFIFLIIPS